jgi:hypothetical protein
MDFRFAARWRHVFCRSLRKFLPKGSIPAANFVLLAEFVWKSNISAAEAEKSGRWFFGRTDTKNIFYIFRL